METKFQTSFIPKKPVVEERGSNSSISLFLLISIIVFLVSLGLAGWVFIQKDMLIKSIEEAGATIKSNKEQFELGTIEEMVRLDSRIKNSKKLLAGHVSVVPIFRFLENNTLKKVRFKSFTFSSAGKDESGATLVKVTMSGQAFASAESYKIISLQADIFGSQTFKNIIKSPLLSDLNPTADGGVSFSASMFIYPDFLSYSSKSNIKKNQ